MKHTIKLGLYKYLPIMILLLVFIIGCSSGSETAPTGPIGGAC